MKAYLHGPTDSGEKLKLQFRVENLNGPERRKKYAITRRRMRKMHDIAPLAKQWRAEPM